MQAEPQKEHRWLHKLVGEWTSETEAAMGPGMPVEKFLARDTVRSVGGLWVQSESRGEIPGGSETTMQMTLGYSPEKQRFVGTFLGSMMTWLWVYEGTLDAAERVLTLETEGPNMMAGGKLAKFKDIIEIHSDDYREMRSQMQGDDGSWTELMIVRYRRIR